MEDQINEVLCNFDFDKVHKAMVAVEWTWSDNKTPETLSIPTRDQLVACARDLLEKISVNKGQLRTGGFCAWCYDGNEPGAAGANIGLSFTLESSDVDF